MNYRTIKFERKDSIARITLNRPEVLNAISQELLDELAGAMQELRGSRIKAVVITGEGSAFSTGADLRLVDKSLTDLTLFTSNIIRFNEVMQSIAEFPVPVIAAVNGFAFAGGLELLLSCDIAIAADDAVIGDQHMNFGLVGGPVMWLLPQRLGLQKAMELVCTGKWLTGREAEGYGLVLRAVPREKLEDEVEAILTQFRNKSLAGLKLCKKVLRGAVNLPQREALEFIIAQITTYMAIEDDPKEGIRAFLGKRQPRFD